MGFWPFGRGKEKDEGAEVEFASRVVSASPQDGTIVRGKLTIHFVEPTRAESAREVAEACAHIAENLFAEAPTFDDLLGEEAAVSGRILARIPLGLSPLRSLEVFALHVVGDVIAQPASSRPPRHLAEVPSSFPRRPLSDAPPSYRPAPRSEPPPSSYPPAPRSEPPDSWGRSHPVSEPPSPAASTPLPGSPRTFGRSSPPHRQSSSQILAVRSEPLVAAHSTPEQVGRALVPLVRDATTKLLFGILRAYDLLVVRGITIDDSQSDLLAEMVPISTAPAGFFERSRIDELDRWEDALGYDAIDALRTESATVVAYLLHRCLDHVKVPMLAATTILETIDATAFDRESSPLADISRYLHSIDGKPASSLAAAIVDVLGHADVLEHLEVVLTPVLASLQEDLSLAASQSEASLL